MKDIIAMNDFPEFFKGSTMLGFECGEGWHDIIGAMLKRLREIHAELTFGQIKSKFGELRVFYTLPEGVDRAKENEIRDVIDFFGDRCASTCEVCGAPGIKSTIGGWIRVACPWHELLDRREEQKELLAEIKMLREELGE